ncbi:MAG: glycosyltransferase family 9 protein [Bacteroidota bacterium]
MISIPKEEIKKILIIKLRGIGDVVLSTIVLNNLKTDFPDSTIDYLTDPPSKAGLEGLKYINQVITYPKKFVDRIKLINQIRKQKYDLILDFYSNPTTAQITFLSGAKYRCGFPYRGRRYAYNIFGPSERGRFHAATLHLEFLKSIGLSDDKQNLHFYTSEGDNIFADNWLEKNLPADTSFFGISPSGGWQSKKCDPDILANFGNEITKKYPIKALILWGPGDYDDAIEIKKILGNSAFIAPSTTIRQMAAFISKCKFVIANDSGPMHISTAVGIPTLSIHGPTDPTLQGPFGDKHEWINLAELDCIVCNLLTCPKMHECFRDLPINRVIEKVDKLITKNKLQF